MFGLYYKIYLAIVNWFGTVEIEMMINIDIRCLLEIVTTQP
jgi:hypothetical protein